MVANAGIDLQQAAVLRAGDACVSVTHRVITRAVVANFVAGHWAHARTQKCLHGRRITTAGNPVGMARHADLQSSDTSN